VIKIIRKSEGRTDAAQKLMTRFKLSEEQVDAILELRLYRLARLEILIVQKELGERRAEAKRLDSLLKTPAALWALVKTELGEIKAKYADKRRTKVLGAVDEPEYQAEDFIVAEDANIILSTQGWVKRVREVKDLGTTRLREGDSVFAAVAGSTRSVVAFFSNFGGCYACRIHEILPSTGYGDPVQKLFKLADGERMIAMLSFDPRVLEVPAQTEGAEEPEEPLALAMTKAGFGFRFSLRTHHDPSTRSGRRFAKPKEGDEVLAVFPVNKGDIVVCASGDGHALAVAVKEIPALVGAGKGAIVMDVTEGDRLIGAMIAPNKVDRFKAETDKGKERDFKLSEVMGSRANRGSAISKRDALVRLVLPPLEAPTFSTDR
jgi:DNA gyrase subunit A